MIRSTNLLNISDIQLRLETHEIVAIRGRSIRVGAPNVKAFGDRSASAKRAAVASGVSEAPRVRTSGTRCSARRGGGDAGTWFVVEHITDVGAPRAAVPVVVVMVVVVMAVALAMCKSGSGVVERG